MKQFIILLLLSVANCLYAQKQSDRINVPGGYERGSLFEIYDQYGNKYNPSDILISDLRKEKQGTILKSNTMCSAGVFELHFDQGSGMNNTSDPVHTARRNVVCKLFNDISNFINTPLTTTGVKIHIWIRNINDIPNLPASALGVASSFYSTPINVSPGFGGIVDNEIWKTIHTGANSFTNTTMPLMTSGDNVENGQLYHGFVAINFNNVTVTNPVWNTNLSIVNPSNLFDLYSVMLHEVTHALGFASLIGQNGTSSLGPGSNYFTRFDTFLRNNASSQSLITTSNSCNMYNYSFNTALNTSVLHPNIGACVTDQTSCASAVRFVSSINIPVYTPNCYEAGSSLSHFEDQCFTPHTNNSYFAMCNAGGTGITRRFLRPEERQALCDIGYSLKTSYGDSATVNGTITYAGSVCIGITVAGINDGINPNGTYAFVTNSGVAVQIPNILANDRTSIMSNLRFEGLQDVFDSTALIPTVGGDAAANVTFSSTATGLHLLRYIPFDNVSQQRGNITYIYVFVRATNSCALPTACDLVVNGTFEAYSSLPTALSQIHRSCGWYDPDGGSPDYFHAQSPDPNMGVPCNTFGNQPDNIASHGAYAGLWTGEQHTERVATRLSAPLSPNTAYILSFDISLGDATFFNSQKIQASLGTIEAFPYGVPFPTNAQSIILTNPTFTTNSIGWDRISFEFETGDIAGQNILIIGDLVNNQHQHTVAPFAPHTCPYFQMTSTIVNRQYYFVDNVSLIPTYGAEFNLPLEICDYEQLPDLNEYLSAIPEGGIFSGPGVSGSGGICSFNATTAGIGNKTVIYTYINSVGCNISMSADILVIDCEDPEPEECPPSVEFTAAESETTAAYQAGESITASGNYMINSGSDILMRAGVSIDLLPDTEIKFGADYLALIGYCIYLLPEMEKKPDGIEEIKSFGVYPNPTTGLVTITSESGRITAIDIAAFDGKVLFSQRMHNVLSYDANLSNYESGVYIFSVTTEDGSILKKRVIKR